MADNSERLEKLIGFDAAKNLNVTEELFADVVGEIKKERLEKAKVLAKEQLLKAMDLREKMVKVEREFAAQKKKFEKELGSLLGKLEFNLRGGPPPKQEDTQPSE